ncbi:hypothetical protein DRJ17_05255 [Candidatus Woesearchaeota archaeon]|mgnify:CR=1 FL=1|nr:MAG: hypothetical protein DRJ17_05255 [Candidatus Woesearchaeota archaeon]
MQPIGFTTGITRKFKQSFAKSINLIAKTKATSIEISARTLRELRKLYALINSDRFYGVEKNLAQFHYISFHSPWSGFVFNFQNLDLLERINEIANKINAKNIVFHPDIIRDCRFYNYIDERASFENMGKGKDDYNDAKSLEQLHESYGNKLVLDLQHLWETFSLDDGQKFITETREYISEIHVSGYNESSIHCLFSDSINKKEILDLLKKCPKKPIILKGAPNSLNIDELNNELELILEYTA